ncbi:MAG: glycosyltransferase family 9 protein [Candidatus Aminicenantes bacterium]|nr:glycosyltransferase family 9 protein [Candidatus Aminicenantes bacterium]
MTKYLIIRTSSLGDIVHTIPAFAALRLAEPEARISWVVSPKGRPILDLVAGLDEIITIGEPGWKRSLRDRDRIALDFQGLIKSAWLGRLSGARRRLGFASPNLREPLARLFYTEQSPVQSEKDHVILKNIRLLELLGFVDRTIRFPLTVPEGLVHGVEDRLSETGYTGGIPLVIFNVGAGWPTKRWLPGRWIETLGKIDRNRMFPVLLWGTREEQRTAAGIGVASGVPLLPFLDLAETFALFKNAAVLASGDTFALQAACAVGLPVVALFGPTNPLRNGPFTPRDRVVYHELPCGRCYRRSCPNPKCMTAVGADEVVRAIEEVLSGRD